ncbi:SusC/RagA family TonB-linked outer membrane protein [Cellulophaga sp. F20128]|uniref:SusC/RagA family TonB-linked outer membrane protein n=1 Tax=Cellulophaga sp. F20128 TaxID=2926413 RepID=UPI001FF22FD3|nr:SusC/RagA family TonB-linked outer membrane protein [Cellulophaga sp. F20128]MCK0156348.1 SusC/RagA family TonB-linked outer membrane protein [Cellulophaga sp. F20128]
MKNNSIVKGRCFLCAIFYLFISLFYANTIHAKASLNTSFTTVFTLQESLVTGRITDKNGMPVPDVTIRNPRKQMGAISDFEGNFKIQANPKDTLVFSALGFVTQTIVVYEKKNILVLLVEDVTQLNEIVLNAGYYTVKEKERTGNIAKLSAETIEKQPVNNPLAAMQGHLSGVNIVQNTAVPGGGYNIEIRGKNFINGGTEPLYVVDGVPFGSESLASVSISVGINGANISPLNAMNPNDIESVEVLKDADATAIYGSRAANGVVLITTKKGKAGKTKFNVNMSSTLSTVSHFLDLMNTQQYLEARMEGIINDGYGTLFENPSYDRIWPDVKNWDQNRYTNWQKELIGGTAYRNKMQLSVSGGSEQTQFLINGAYQNETTVFPGDSKYGKASMHSNINHQSKDNRFKINFATIYSREKNNLPRTDLTSEAYTIEPNAPAIFDENGDLNWENNTFDNPYALLEEDYQVQINTLIGNAAISYEIVPDLLFKTNLGFTTYDLDSYRILPSSARNPRFGFTPIDNSSLTTNSSARQSWIVEPQLHWKQDWNTLDLNILLGTTFQNQTTEQVVINGRGFPNNDLIRNISAAKSLQILEDSDSNYKYQAFFGRINLNLKSKYILNLTGRRDGSSRFGPAKQFGNFGAVGLAWIFSEESLLKNSSFLSFGKFRASLGTTGSDNIGDYQFLDSYKVSGNNYNGITVVEPSGIFNPLFGWEVNKKLEVALELGLFEDRLLLNSVWYQNRSSNQLIGIPLAATTGFGSLTGNFDATVENTGLEIDLTTRNIQRKHFSWNTNFNITVPKNRLVKFPELETSTFANRLIIGEPLSIVHLYNALGVDATTGMYEFQDYNEDGNITSLYDKQIIEDFSPKFYGGLANTFTYKNLSLNMFFQFKKQKGYNSFRAQSVTGHRSNGSVALLDRWKQIGDTAPVMLATASLNPNFFNAFSYQRFSNAAVSDASFIRLRNISLTYNFSNPKKNRMDASVYLQGQNLLTITSYDGPDPEQSSHSILPPLRQITLGLQLSF